MSQSASKLETLKQLEQSIHNLRMRWPIGIRSIDDAHDDKLRRLERTNEEEMAKARRRQNDQS